jgi:predicted transcriptional regulator
MEVSHVAPVKTTHLSRRERQIMDILYKTGRATSAEVMDKLPDPPSYSSVRTMLRILEEKGHVRHEQDGAKYVFVPIVRRDQAKKSALRHLMDTFFDGSAAQVMAALLDISSRNLSEKELAELKRLIAEAQKGKE